jgi:hypothetical protein
VFRQSDGNWYFHNSGDHQYTGFHWGQNGDIPVPGDYDGDGYADVAVFRDGTGSSTARQSTSPRTRADLLRDIYTIP